MAYEKQNFTNGQVLKAEHLNKIEAELERLGSGSGGGTADAVQYIPQELTEAQQMQARANLGLYGTVSGLNEVVLADVTMPYDESNECYMYGGSDVPALAAGNTYLVNFNGTEHKTTALSADMMQPGAVILGNGAELGFDDTGELFCAIIIPGAMAMAIDMSGTVTGTNITFGIKLEGYTNKVPDKYLPDNKLVVVTTIDDETASMTGEEIYASVLTNAACLFSMAGKVVPLVGVSDATMEATFSSLYVDSGHLYELGVVVDADGNITDIYNGSARITE